MQRWQLVEARADDAGVTDPGDRRPVADRRRRVDEAGRADEASRATASGSGEGQGRACAKCHSKGGKAATAKKLGHFDMTSYPFGGHHAMEISGAIRKSLGIDGSKLTMPFDKKGSVKGDELALIAAWADAFDASHKGGAHDGHRDHGHHDGEPTR